MQLESLLLSRDPEVIRVVQPALEKLSIDVEVCRGVNSGQEILRTERFDAIIIDCDDLKGALGVLEGLRKSVSNRNSATFAIVNGSTTTQQAFKMGANFVLQKPISALNAKRCFSAAVNFMMRERRRYFRHPVEMPATLSFGEGQKMKVTVTNLSEGGMAIFFRGPLPKGRVSTVSFNLPGAASALEPKVQVAWMDESGHAGLRFIDVSKETRAQLDAWLAGQSEKIEKPAK
ncbi:MAG TPA: PilZ domain-containing protein [Terriglobales bacterium]|jgi:CheY-like chemotaxis protein|nr:PilZ domain-containing protein [Terriglobales bacterium]